MHHVGLRRLEDAERADVARPFGEHHVAGIEEDAGHQIERLLAADGHHHVVGRRTGGSVDPGQRHDLADPLPQRQVALPAGVLQRGRALLAAELGHHLADRVEWECCDEGSATGERDHLGPRRHGEQSPDLGRGHAAHSLGVPIGIVVERRPGHDGLASVALDTGSVPTPGRGGAASGPGARRSGWCILLSHTAPARGVSRVRSDRVRKAGAKVGSAVLVGMRGCRDAWSI